MTIKKHHWAKITGLAIIVGWGIFGLFIGAIHLPEIFIAIFLVFGVPTIAMVFLAYGIKHEEDV